MGRGGDIFNALPIEIRMRTIPSQVELQIVQLKRERDRVRAYMGQMVDEINNHISNLEETNQRRIRELDDKDAPHNSGDGKGETE